MIYNFYIHDLISYKKGIVYDEKKYAKKLEYKIKNIFDQINKLFEKEEKTQLLEKLKKIEKVVTENTLQSVKYTGERTLEKDCKVIACDMSRRYCKNLIENFEKKELEILKIEKLIIYLVISMYEIIRKK